MCTSFYDLENKQIMPHPTVVFENQTIIDANIFANYFLAYFLHI